MIKPQEMRPKHSRHYIFTLSYAYDRKTRVTFPDGTHEDVEYNLFEVAKSWDRQGRGGTDRNGTQIRAKMDGFRVGGKKGAKG